MKRAGKESGRASLWILLGLVLGITGIMNVLWGQIVDYDKDNLPDAYEMQHGYTVDGLYPNELLGWWQWDMGIEDRSANGADGVMSGFTAGSEYGAGAYHEALNFDADSEVSLSDVSKVDLSGDFSMSLWMKGGAVTGETKVVKWEGTNGDEWAIKVNAN